MVFSFTVVLHFYFSHSTHFKFCAKSNLVSFPGVTKSSPKAMKSTTMGRFGPSSRHPTTVIPSATRVPSLPSLVINFIHPKLRHLIAFHIRRPDP
uniref:Secreted protein n=1 Tax=Panagrellus redivivus TaxID=6233 RepID=A0A7E4VQU6_PANRE